jgi:hypothetical protein
MAKKPKDIALAMKKRKLASKKPNDTTKNWYPTARDRFSISKKRSEIDKDQG